MGFGSSMRSCESDKQKNAHRKEQPEAGAVKLERVALEQRRALLKKRLDAIGMTEVEGELAEVLIAPLRLDADRAEDDVVEPRRDVRIQRARRLRRVEDGRLEA